MIPILYTPRGAFALLLLGLGFAAPFPVPAAVPKVVATQPKGGDQNVSPAQKEIVVTFDQNMDPKVYSFTGGGPTFP